VATTDTLDLNQDSGANLARRVAELSQELEVERAERERATQALADANRIQAVLERDKGVAESEVLESRRQLEQERLERSLLESRMTALQVEHDLTLATLGWWSGRRYRRRSQAKTAHPSTTV
jgi:hypothetical protein